MDGGVNVDGEDVHDAGLEGEGEGPMLMEPEEVGDMMGLDSKEALIVEEATGEGGASGIMWRGGRQ